MAYILMQTHTRCTWRVNNELLGYTGQNVTPET